MKLIKPTLLLLLAVLLNGCETTQLFIYNDFKQNPQAPQLGGTTNPIPPVPDSISVIRKKTTNPELTDEQITSINSNYSYFDSAPFPLTRFTSEKILENLDCFTEAEKEYLAALLPIATQDLNSPEHIEYSSESVSILRFGFSEDTEWGNLLHINGILDSKAIGLFGGFFATGHENENIGTYYNQQGECVLMRRIKSKFEMPSLLKHGYVGMGVKQINVYGEEFDTEAVSQLKENISTMDDTVRLLSNPLETRILRDGTVVWLYKYTLEYIATEWFLSQKLKTIPKKEDILEIRFKDEVAINIGFTTNET